MGLLSPIYDPEWWPPERRRIYSYQEWFRYLGELVESRPADVFYYPVVGEEAFTVH